MNTVFIHPFAGVLSAYGMGLADQAVLREQAVETELTGDLSALDAVADRLAAEATEALIAQGADPASIHAERRAHVRYAGTQAALEVPLGPGLRDDFTAAHRARFGFATPERALVVEAVAVEAIAPGERVVEPELAARTKEPSPLVGDGRVRGAPGTIDSDPSSRLPLLPLDTVTIWTGGDEHAAPCSNAPPCSPATAFPARR